MLKANGAVNLREAETGCLFYFGGCYAFDSRVIKSISGAVYEAAPGDSIAVTAPDTLRITLAFDPEFGFDKKIMEASLRAVDDLVPETFIVSIMPSDKMQAGEQNDWLIWLSEKPVPNTPAKNNILFGKSASANTPLLEQNVQGWILTRRLNEEIALREKLPLQLFSILISNTSEDQRLAKSDRRIMPDEKMWSTDSKAVEKSMASTPFYPNTTAVVLAVLLMICLMAERLLAFKRNQ